MGERSWNEGYLNVGGIRTHYLEAGEGETLVLIHGGLAWCCAELTYGTVIEPLSRRMHVVAVDVAGHGFTDGRGLPIWRAASQGDFVIRFLRTLGISAHLAGNSHGGWLVQYVAHEAPELVNRLVIINSLNGTSPIPTDFALPLEPDKCPSAEEVRNDLLAFYFNKHLVTPERVARTHDYTVRNHDFARARLSVIGSTPAEWNENLMYRGRHISESAQTSRCRCS